jgi:tripartite ATP-independent transporter DctP family solute receptor
MTLLTTPNSMPPGIRRRSCLTLAAAWSLSAQLAHAQGRQALRISTPAVPDDWHARMWTVMKDQLEQAAPGQFDVQINLNASLFKQGAEPVAMARGNLEMTTLSAFDIAKLVPEFSIFTAGYVIRDPAHLLQVFNGPIGQELFKRVAEKMDITVLAPIYYGTRQLNLRERRNIKTPADLKGVKLRMPGSREWLFLGEALGATPTPLAFGEVYLGLRTGTIDAQDNPLPTVKSAKFHEVTQQITLTGHLVDVLFIGVASKFWNHLSPEQQTKLKGSAQAAARYNNENRMTDERQLVDYFKSQGLSVTTPDLDAFRKSVQAAYLNSDYAKVWPKGLLERINATR